MKVWIKKKHNDSLELFGFIPDGVLDLQHLYHTGSVRCALSAPLGPPTPSTAAESLSIKTASFVEYETRHPSGTRYMDVIVVEGAKDLAEWHRCASYPQGREHI